MKKLFLLTIVPALLLGGCQTGLTFDEVIRTKCKAATEGLDKFPSTEIFRKCYTDAARGAIKGANDAVYKYRVMPRGAEQ